MIKNNTLQWAKESIFYQIFPERFFNGDKSNDPHHTVSWNSSPTRENFFGGDLQGIINKLPYLKELGISALYLNPIFLADTNHKYDTIDYKKIDPAFGTQETFTELVSKAHQVDIRILLDAVFNHCGAGFWAFQDLVKNGADSPYKDWFFPQSLPIQMDPVNYQTCGGTWYLPKLNTDNADVKEHLLHVSRYWIEEFKIDGWRLDVPWKTSFQFWKEFYRTVKESKPDAYITGEVWRGPEQWTSAEKCDGIMNYPLRNAILDYFAFDHIDAEDFDFELKRLLNIYGDAASLQLNLLGSHDTPRFLTLCKNNVNRYLLAITFLFTFIGIPMIYYGDEIGMVGENDPDCRKPMCWNEDEWNQQILKRYKQMIKVRSQYPMFVYGDFEPLFTFNGVYAYKRSLANQTAIIILNPRDAQRDLNIPTGDGSTSTMLWRDVFSSQEFIQEGTSIPIETLPAQSALLLFPEKRGNA